MSSQSKLFGTDGVRDVAGAGALAPANLARLGRAIARAAGGPGHRGSSLRVLVGRDPRPSGPSIEADLSRGLTARGAVVESAGVLPTPAVSFLVRRHGYDLGIVISASHNPPEYNGVKLFERDGTKASDALEAEVERVYAALDAEDAPAPPSGESASGSKDVSVLAREYVDAIVALDPSQCAAGRRVVLDCANGATGAGARAAFAALGVEALVRNGEMDGARINDGSGALHPELAAAAVRESGAFAGFSFDGDGDRVIAIDEAGVAHDGDDILCALALFLRSRGALPGAAVVATVLSNMGLERALGRAGIALERVPVGDRHVSRRLLDGGFALGGEQSGHIVLARAVGPTGDGIACAVEILMAAAALDLPLSRLLRGFERFPQVALNVRVSRKPLLSELPPVREAIARAEAALVDRGRIVVRYSGTEPLARVMVEAEDAALTEITASLVAAAIERDRRERLERSEAVTVGPGGPAPEGDDATAAPRSSRRRRILIGKPGLDGHNRGVHVLVRALRDAGFEVVYTGIRRTAEQIVEAAVQEDVAAVGVSSLSGAHMTLFPEIAERLAREAPEALLFCGGIIPDEDRPTLERCGYKGIFGPGASTDAIVRWLDEQLTPMRDRRP